MTDKTVSLLKIGCTGLGMFDELIKVKEGIVTLGARTTILCYTDGVVEVENEKGEDFGIESLRKILLASNSQSMKEVNETIIEKLDVHRKTNPYIDDITLFSCRIF